MTHRTIRLAVVAAALTLGLIGAAAGAAQPAFAAQSALTATPQPVITGPAVVGATLSAVTGTWSPAPVTLSYKWMLGSTAIPAATKATYVLRPSDIGKKVTLTVTGSKTSYKTVAMTSLPTAAVTGAGSSPAPITAFTASPSPTITGSATIGSTLTAVTGSWAPAPVTFVYTWFSGGVVVAGRGTPTYPVTAADAGKKITVTITGSEAGFTSLSRSSPATATVPASAPTAFTSTPAPTILGTAVVGAQLTAATGTWVPGNPTFSFIWYSGGVAITGQTGPTYTVGVADVGKKITLTVTGRAPGITAVSKSSQATPTVPAPAAPGAKSLTALPIPVITGTATVGQTLTASSGAWAPAPVALTYQWARAGTPIADATAQTYAISAADAGAPLTVTVTGSKSGYTTFAQTSPAVTVYAAGTGYDVVVILGQSNAQGAGFPADPALDVPVAGLDQLAGSGSSAGTIIPAADSLYQVTQWNAPTGGPRVGPGMTFGRDLLKTEPADRRVLLVPAAQGTTSMTGDANYSWDPANTTAAVNLYARALTQIDLALKQNPDNRLVAIIWAQGESDALLSTGAVYKAKLLSLVDGLRSHYGTVPVLIGGMVPEFIAGSAARQSIDAAHRAIPDARPQVAYVPGVAGHSQDDSLHYDPAGARAMGDKYFATFTAMQGR